MISQCLNPECRKELHYLRSGRVIRTTLRIGSEVRVEHFWLCGECYRSFDFHFAGDGTMSMVPRNPHRFSVEKGVEDGWYLDDTEQRLTA